MVFTHVAIAGSTGNIGVNIAKAVIARKELTVKILTRTDTLTSKKALLDEYAAGGAEIVAVDFSSKDSLTSALKGCEVLLSATSGYHLLEQVPLAEAAKAAGVTRFYPSEYGIDYVNHPGVQHPILDMKKQVRQAVLGLGLEVVTSCTGFFAEWSMSPFYGVDFEKNTIEMVGDGNVKIGHWPMAKVGEVVAESINHPLMQKPGQQEFFLTAQGLVATWNEVVDAYERANGVKFTRNHITIEEAEARIAANNDPFADFGMYLRVWQAKGYGVSPNNLAPQFSTKAGTFDDLYRKK